MATPQRFPEKTALTLATAILLLILAHRIDPTKGLSPTIFPQAAHVELLRHTPAPILATQTPPPPPPPTPTPTQPPGHPAPKPTRPAISAYLIDDSGALDPFYAQLHQLELPATTPATHVVTILHYGDSPTTADLITGDTRRLLQQRFGDAGLGFLLPARPWAWYQHTGVDLSDHNWTISTAVGKGREEVYGLGGASFEGNASASTRITLKSPTQSAIDIAYLARPAGADLNVLANSTPIEPIHTADPATHPAFWRQPLPAGTTTIELHPTGPLRLYGETLYTGHRGILYSSLGLNGASTSVLSNGFNAAAWSTALQHAAPALVVINYGTNESSFGPYVDKYYEHTLRTSIARIRNALPAVPILIMSPMDRGLRTGVDDIQTYDTIPRIIAIQRRVAAELHCAFFDTFDAMGGDGTMARWYTGHPRLVAGDLIHPTPQGAAIVANLFVQDLLRGYQRYLGQPLPPPPAPTPPPNTQPTPSKITSKPEPAPAPEPTPTTETPKAPEHEDPAPPNL